MTRIGIFGWGVVAPRSPDVDSFAANLETAGTWLEPFNGFGPDTFLVGRPSFDFERYKPWIDARFPPNRFPQLAEKMDPTVQFAIGAFIQSLEQNPGIEQELQTLGAAAHVYIGTGLGCLPTIHRESLVLHRAQRRWDRFWAAPERNAAMAEYLALPGARRAERAKELGVPPDPEGFGGDEREAADEEWWHFWAGLSDRLARYLDELREIEGLKI